MATCTSRRALAHLCEHLADTGESFTLRLDGDAEAHAARITDVTPRGFVVSIRTLGERVVRATWGGTAVDGVPAWLSCEPVEG